MHEHEYVSEEMLCVLAQIAGEDGVLMAEPMREHTTFKIGGPADVLVAPRTTDAVSEEMLCVLAQIAGEDGVLMAEPMREHTTFKIGGPADVLVAPRTTDALVRVLDTCYAGGVPVTVVGNGSDLLVGDRGIRGVVVLLRDNFAGIEVDASHWRVTAEAGALLRDVAHGSDLLVGDRGIRGVVVLLRDNFAGIEVDASHWRVTAEAGALLRDVARAAADQGLSGMEPLWGIPATVGGACFMNAGAYGGTTGEVLESVRVYVPSKQGNRGSVVTLEARDLKMGYRKSRVHDDCVRAQQTGQSRFGGDARGT